MSQSYNVVTSDFVYMKITTSGQESLCSLEKRFAKGLTISDLKGKLELLTGANASTMHLTVFNNDDHLVCSLDDENAVLGSYHIDDGMRLHVEDLFTLKEELKRLEIDSKVEKFEISDEDYNKRSDSVKAYLAQNKLGKYNAEEVEKREEERKREREVEEAKAKTITIGNRCLVTVPNQPKRRASVMFVGTTQTKPGWWIGVKYDEPFGRNDGTLDGVRYFECLPKYGGFVKAMHVQVGDFPEEEIDLEEEL